MGKEQGKQVKRSVCLERDRDWWRNRQKQGENYFKENGWEDNRTNWNGRNCAQRV